MPKVLYVLIDYPFLIAIPIVFFAGLALWSGSRTAWVATIAWCLYLAYEIGMNTALLCSGDACLRRTPLIFGYPVLAFLSMVALVQAYVHLRDRPRWNRRT